MQFNNIAIVHDALCVAGGAERLTAILSQIFPQADLFTSAYIPEDTFAYFKTKEIQTLPLAKFVHTERKFKRLYPVWLMGFRNLDLYGYDLILSSSTYLAKFIKAPKESTHVCYLHSPLRFLWKRESYTSSSLPFKKPFIKILDWFIPPLQRLDKKYTQKISHILTNSQNMAAFIKKVYNLESSIIYPPIEVNDFKSSAMRKEFYLCAGRLVSYKRTDLAIKACLQSGRKLRIAGTGPELDSLRKWEGNDVEFLGLVSDEELKDLFSEARALLFPGVEDFGIIPLEAQASGCPVIAYRAGGVLETVIDGVTGIYFDTQSEQDLIVALDRFESHEWRVEEIRKNALRFDTTCFARSIKTYLDSL